MRNILTLALIICACAFSGCTFVPAINKDNTLPKNKSKAVFIDAKQRAVFTEPYKEAIQMFDENGDKMEGKFEMAQRLRVCSEAAPDVFTAIASSAGLDLSIDPAEKKGSAQFAAALAENAANIGRTQTINMLRELMYRTCERYLNGAIDKDELVVQAARDQRVMVSILAIEQLTGVYTPIATALTSNAGASAGVPPNPETIKLVADAKSAADKAREDAEKAKSDAEDAKKTAEDALKAGKSGKATCEAALAADEAAPEDKKLTDGEKKACATAKEKQAASDSAEATAQDKAEAYKTILDTAEKLTGAASAAAAGQVHFNTAESQADMSQSMAQIASTIENIVSNTFYFDELNMACVVAMRREIRNEGVPRDLIETCVRYFNKQAESYYKASFDIDYTRSQESIQIDKIVDCAFPLTGEDKMSNLATILQLKNPNRDSIKELSKIHGVVELRRYLQQQGPGFINKVEAEANDLCGKN